MMITTSLDLNILSNGGALTQGFNGMDLGLKASFMYWYPAQSGTFGSSPWVKHEERTTTN
jgi:hypothetical protein